jgi:hypothetical protein
MGRFKTYCVYYPRQRALTVCCSTFMWQVKMLSSVRKERISQLISQYGDLLLFLKEKGALLNGVCPEYLLTKDDFLFYKVRQLSGYLILDLQCEGRGTVA